MIDKAKRLYCAKGQMKAANSRFPKREKEGKHSYELQRIQMKILKVCFLKSFEIHDITFNNPENFCDCDAFKRIHNLRIYRCQMKYGDRYFDQVI